MRQHARARTGKRYRLGAERPKIEMTFETRARFLRRHNVEELLLARRRAYARNQIVIARLWLAHVGLLILP
jgi:hypothetical protein